METVEMIGPLQKHVHTEIQKQLLEYEVVAAALAIQKEVFWGSHVPKHHFWGSFMVSE